MTQWQASTIALPSASQAMPQGLLVPSAKTWNSRVRGWMRPQRAGEARARLPLLST